MNKLNDSFKAVLLGMTLAVVAILVSHFGIKAYFYFKPSNNPVKASLPSKATVTNVNAYAPVNEANRAPQSLDVIELTADNTVVMDQVFNDQSVTTLMVEIQALANRVPKGSTVYLVLNTPGGSVDAGLRLISFVKALPIKVKTLTLFAASMGFMTAQQLDERLILDTGTLMSHRAKFGVRGEAPGELFSQLKWIMSQINALEGVAASRMGLSHKDYSALVADEYWVYGHNAITDKAADRAVLAKCGTSLQGTRTITVDTMFGAFGVELSKCPLIPGFIKAEPKGNAKAEGLEYVKKMFGTRKAFVQEYIVTNEWMRFQK